MPLMIASTERTILMHLEIPRSRARGAIQAKGKTAAGSNQPITLRSCPASVSREHAHCAAGAERGSRATRARPVKRL